MQLSASVQARALGVGVVCKALTTGGQEPPQGQIGLLGQIDVTDSRLQFSHQDHVGQISQLDQLRHVGESGDRTWRDIIEPDDEPTTLRPPLALAEPAPEVGPPKPEPNDAAIAPAAPAAPVAPANRDTSRMADVKRPGKIGKYDLRDKLGRGAFGVVYLARDPSLERDIAIKVLRLRHLTNGDIVQRFLQEARATARIAHPGIVTIYDCGLVEAARGPTAFIAMELLSGESLTQRLARSGRLAPGLATEIVRQVASALEAAHRVDVLHRDLKPDNIYLVPDPAMPSGERVKILDFGLAKLGQGGHTAVQNVFGTPRYMSPEQCRSSAQVDHRGDIYSLGCILFELVTGCPPFEGNVRQVIDRHQRAQPPRAASLAPECPSALDDLIAEMLAKDPAARPQSMAAVQRQLQGSGTVPLATAEAMLPPVARPRASPVPPPAIPELGPGALSGEIAMPVSGAHVVVEPITAAPRRARPGSSGHPTPPARAVTLSAVDRRLRQMLARYARGDEPARRVRYTRLVAFSVGLIALAVAAAFAIN